MHANQNNIHNRVRLLPIVVAAIYTISLLYETDDAVIPSIVESAWIDLVGGMSSFLQEVLYILYPAQTISMYLSLAMLTFSIRSGRILFSLSTIMLLSSAFLFSWTYETSVDSFLGALLWLSIGVQLTKSYNL